MPIVNQSVAVKTAPDIGIYNITPQIEAAIAASGIVNGRVLVFSRHTTTALAINEDEERLLADIRAYLNKLAPRTERYLHNDLHLRDVPPGEPMNAHAHLMAMTLSTSEIIPIVEGQLALGTYQSVLFFELDGPRQRSVFLQIWGDRTDEQV
jgi:secondary thiamine-phosphate synthase enzyme